MDILWTKSTESGLGDRLCDILYLSVYARIRAATVIVLWSTYKGHEKHATRSLDPSHRYVDTDIDNVKRYIKFPNNVKILPYLEFAGKKLQGWIIENNILADLKKHYDVFENALGGCIEPQTFFDAHCSKKVTYDEFLANFDKSTSEFSFNDDIKEYLATLPENFMTLHVRRGDKVRNEDVDGTNIYKKDLEELNQLTYKCLDFYIDKFDYFFVCSDEDEKAQEFSNYLRDHGKHIVRNRRNLEKWQQTFFDIATMSKSKVNIVSNRYSSFSRFPSFLGKGKWNTVYDWHKDN